MISNWREELREVVDEIEPKAEKKVKEGKGINNKIIINPKLGEAVEEIGGELIEMKEVDGDEEKKDNKDDSQVKQKERQGQQMKKRVLLAKLRAVRSTGGADIMASYEPEIDSAIEYFYEEGINEEGIDLIIEEIGLEEFVTFVDFIHDETKFLNEQRAARKASVRAKKFDVVKKEVDKADAARRKAKKGEYAPSYAKKETDVTVYDDKPTAKKKAPVKKTVVKKAAPKPVAKKPVTKKVVNAVAKVKKTQPVKKATKQGLGDKIRSAYKAGVKRHRKATQGARVFGKGFAAGAKKAVKFAKDVKKVVEEKEKFTPHKMIDKKTGKEYWADTEEKHLKYEKMGYVHESKEELLEKDLSAAERRALPNKDFVFPGKGEGPEGKQRGAYPINDKKHARNALAMAAAHASPEKEAKVKAAVKKKYPDIEVSESVMKFVKDRISKKKSERKAQKATDAGARARRILQQKDHEKVNFLPMEEGKGYQPEIEHSKLGDAKKKADKERESKLPPHLQGDAIGKMKKAFATEAVKGQDTEMRKMAAQDRASGKDKRLSPKEGRRSVKPVRYRYNEGEDKAFNFVLDKIKKEVGKSGYVSKDNPRKPQSAADKAKVRAHQAKIDKENAAARAKDPSQGRYPKG